MALSRPAVDSRADRQRPAPRATNDEQDIAHHLRQIHVEHAQCQHDEAVRLRGTAPAHALKKLLLLLFALVPHAAVPAHDRIQADGRVPACHAAHDPPSTCGQTDHPMMVLAILDASIARDRRNGHWCPKLWR
jgi:hypothetical protein